jgi:putative phage-type endonuclease
MLINQDFSVDRTKYIGGSDIGAILGLSKFRSPLEVWLEKTGKEIKRCDALPLRFGSFAEEFVAQEYSKACNLELLHDQSIYIHPEHSYMSAHIDRFILGDGKNLPPTKILECKTANPFSQNEWGDAGSDQVPMSYLAQCIWYMAITGIEKTDLAVLFGNSDFRIYHIERDAELEKLVLEKAEHFWENHVVKNIAPPIQSEADCHTLFAKSISEKTAVTDQKTYELTKRLHVLNDEIVIKESEISQIKQILMSQLGQAEILTYQGQVLATWRAPKPSYRLDSKRLETEHPELANQYKTPIQNSRRLVIKELSL